MINCPIYGTVVTGCSSRMPRSLGGNILQFLPWITLQPFCSVLCTAAGLIQHHQMMACISSHQVSPPKMIQSLCKIKNKIK